MTGNCYDNCFEYGHKLHTPKCEGLRAKENFRRAKLSIEALLELVHHGVLVRNTENDGDLAKYLRQSTTLVLALQQAKDAIDTK